MLFLKGPMSILIMPFYSLIYFNYNRARFQPVLFLTRPLQNLSKTGWLKVQNGGPARWTPLVGGKEF